MGRRGGTGSREKIHCSLDSNSSFFFLKERGWRERGRIRQWRSVFYEPKPEKKADQIRTCLTTLGLHSPSLLFVHCLRKGHELSSRPDWILVATWDRRQCLPQCWTKYQVEAGLASLLVPPSPFSPIHLFSSRSCLLVVCIGLKGGRRREDRLRKAKERETEGTS